MAVFTYTKSEYQLIASETAARQSLLVFGMDGPVEKLEIALDGLRHVYAADIDMLLVAPDSQSNLVFWSGAGNGATIDGDFVISDDAPALLPANGPLAAGEWRPTARTAYTSDPFGSGVDSLRFAAGRGDGAAYTLKEAFGGIAGNGVWNLYTRDSFSAFDDGSLDGWSLTITTASDALRIDGTVTADTIVVNSADAHSGSAQFNGSAMTYSGVAGAYILSGHGGDDTIVGGIGNDIIDGGEGADELRGGAGDDTYYIDDAGDRVIEQDGEGTDRAYTSVNLALDLVSRSYVEEFALIGTASKLGGTQLAETFFANPLVGSTLYGKGGNDLLQGGAMRDLLYGGPGDDTMHGGGGNDRLDGSNGIDAMFGGTGNDEYYVRQIGDAVIELAGEGDDTVRALVDYTLPDNVENLRLYRDAAVGTGNALDNFMFGRTIATTLYGMDGNDRLFGREGGDTLDGGAGDDRLNGAAGDDLLDGGSGNDTLAGGPGNDTLLGGEGADRIGGGSGGDRLDGGAGADQLFGDEGADTITGGANRDVMTGSDGADTFVFADGDFAGLGINTADRILDFLPGEDTLDLSAVDAIAGGEDDAFAFIGSANFTGTGGELRFAHVGADTMLYMDIDGDGAADYAIRLDGMLDLTGGNFIL